MTKENIQSLYECIDSLASARAAMAITDYQLAKREITAVGNELDGAVKNVNRSQQCLLDTLARVFAD